MINIGKIKWNESDLRFWNAFLVLLIISFVFIWLIVIDMGKYFLGYISTYAMGVLMYIFRWCIKDSIRVRDENEEYYQKMQSGKEIKEGDLNETNR